MPSSRSVESLKVQLMAAAYKQRVGERIRTAREAKGWTQRDLAYALPGRVDGPAISRWERGMVMPQTDTLEALASALEVDVAYFMVEIPAAANAETPDPFESAVTALERRMQALEDELRTQADRYGELIAKQNELLAGQSGILEQIRAEQGELRRLIVTQESAAQRLERAAELIRAARPIPAEPEPEPIAPRPARR